MKQKGQAIILAIMAVGIVLSSTLFIIGGSQIYYQNATYMAESEKATAIAEAALDKAVASLNITGGSFNGEGNGVSGIAFGDGEYSITITSVGATAKTIDAVGFVPSKQNPKTTRRLRATATKGIGAAFNYGLQVGSGGLDMSNLAWVNGSVYSNGNVRLNNLAGVSGDVYVAGGVAAVADQQTDCTPPNCVDFIFGKTVNGQAQLDVAQSFKPSVSKVINKVSLKLKKFGNPPNLTVRILGDDASKPDKGDILTSGILSANLVTSEYGFIDVIFNPAINLESDDTYWIMLDTTSSSSNYWAWSNDLSQGYTRGVPKWSANWQAGNSVWNAFNGDLGFKTFMGGVVTSINGSNGVYIGGNAHANTLQNLVVGQGAYYQTISGVTAQNYFPNSPDPVPAPMPLSEANINEWEQLAQSAGVYTGDITTCQTTLASGKYIGNIILPGNCNISIDSPIWVTGNFAMNGSGGGSTIRLKASYGASSGVIIVDNFVTIDNNNKLQGSGNAGSYLILLSNFDSASDPESRTAINITNGSNSGIVYANNGLINISNGNSLTEVSAWKLVLGNGVIINYDQGLSSAFFTSGPSGSYSLVKGSYQIK